jgi:hypothetical protein
MKMFATAGVWFLAERRERIIAADLRLRSWHRRRRWWWAIRNMTIRTTPSPSRSVILPDGNYRALLLGRCDQQPDMQLTANEEINFFWLNGDLNRDAA